MHAAEKLFPKLCSRSMFLGNNLLLAILFIYLFIFCECFELYIIRSDVQFAQINE